MKTLTVYEQGVSTKLGTWLTFWTKNEDKTFGLIFFREYLESKRAWSAFIKNFHSCQKKKDFIQVYEYILRTKDITNLLEWSFCWNDTIEGYDFWDDINRNVKKFLKQRASEYKVKLTDKAIFTDKKQTPKTPTPNKNITRHPRQLYLFPEYERSCFYQYPQKIKLKIPRSNSKIQSLKVVKMT